MHYLIFTLEFPPMLGGAGTYSYELALGLRELGHRVTVLTSDREMKEGKHDIDFELINKGIIVKRKRWFDKVWFLIWPFFLKREIYAGNYDSIIYANQGAIIVGSKCKRYSINYICTLHGSERYTFLRNSTNNIKSFLVYSRDKIQNFLANADKVVCVSRSLYDDIKESNPSFPLEVIPLGISQMFHREKISYPNQNILICTARLVPDKGQDTIIAACYKLKQEGIAFRLILVGTGPDEIRLKDIIKNYDLENYVEFKGALSRSELAELYKNVDLFILVSRFKETFGLAYLEAMLSGIPVIGSDLGAVPDIIKNNFNGFLINNNDINQLSDDVKKALEKKIEFGLNAQCIAEEYSNIKMAEHHIAKRELK